jgi:hypothetical protein
MRTDSHDNSDPPSDLLSWPTYPQIDLLSYVDPSPGYLGG